MCTQVTKPYFNYTQKHKNNRLHFVFEYSQSQKNIQPSINTQLPAESATQLKVKKLQQLTNQSYSDVYSMEFTWRRTRYKDTHAKLLRRNTYEPTS